MDNRLFKIAVLILVFISSSQCISADEFQREGWLRNTRTGEVFLRYNSTQSKDYYKLSFGCGEDKNLSVSITFAKNFVSGPPDRESVGVKYQFNEEEWKQEWNWTFWKTNLIDTDYDNYTYLSPNPVVFARELLQAMKDKKTQFQFKEIGFRETVPDTLHFDLQGGAGAVQKVLNKCGASPQ